MRVLVVGGGGREHALCLALARDPAVDALICTPGNPGIAALATLLPAGDVVAQAREHDVDLVVVGPEAPLVAGLADQLRAAGIDVFGPSAAAAQLEGSKAFAKDVMAAAGVATGRHLVATTDDELTQALDEVGPPYVVKHDDLAAGKGVVVTDDRDAALRHGQGRRVVVEEFLAGPEVSLFCVTDGTAVVPLLPAQDFKRAGDGDTGPNTGGMGAYAPLPWLPDGFVEAVVTDVAQPVVDEMARRGTPFAGLLYCGLVVTGTGPKVIEFNARFGDPETQVVLPLLETPLAGLLHAAGTGRLAEHPPLRWRDQAAVTVVLAAEGYPGTPTTGDAVEGLDAAEQVEGVTVLHAGTSWDGDARVVTSGGRLLAVTAVGSDLALARRASYDAVDRIRIRGSHHRRDIALTAGSPASEQEVLA